MGNEFTNCWKNRGTKGRQQALAAAAFLLVHLAVTNVSGLPREFAPTERCRMVEFKQAQLKGFLPREKDTCPYHVETSVVMHHRDQVFHCGTVTLCGDLFSLFVGCDGLQMLSSETAFDIVEPPDEHKDVPVMPMGPAKDRRVCAML